MPVRTPGPITTRGSSNQSWAICLIADVASGTDEDTTTPSTPSSLETPLIPRPTNLSRSVTSNAHSSAVRSGTVATRQ
jgi:hypothetical protein